MTIFAPKDAAELEAMLDFASKCEGPCAIRYPRGSAPSIEPHAQVAKGRSHIMKNGRDVILWAAGIMTEKAVKASELLESHGISTGVVNMSCLKPVDTGLLKELAAKVSLIVTLEDNVLAGGIGEEISSMLVNEDVCVMNIGWPDKFIEHGTSDKLYQRYGMDPQSIAERIIREVER